MPSQTRACSKFALYLVDVDATTAPGMEIGSQMMALIDNSAMAEWSTLDASRRCEILSRGKEALLKVALTLVREGSEEQVASVANRLGAGVGTPRDSVVEMFGRESGLKYDAAALGQKLQIYKASLLMQLCWGAAFFAM